MKFGSKDQKNFNFSDLETEYNVTQLIPYIWYQIKYGVLITAIVWKKKLNKTKRRTNFFDKVPFIIIPLQKQKISNEWSL